MASRAVEVFLCVKLRAPCWFVGDFSDESVSWGEISD